MSAFRRILILAVLVPSFSSADIPTRAGPKADSTIRRQRNDVEEEYDRGVQYAEGRGVPQDYNKAAKYYRAAAEKGLSAAQYDLGYL
jgi:TPR repeat protein